MSQEVNLNIFKLIRNLFSHRYIEEGVNGLPPQFLYDSDQNKIRDKVQSGTILNLNEVMVIVNDCNSMKINRPQGINFDTMEYELDRELINNYIKDKYGYPIYYYVGNEKYMKLAI